MADLAELARGLTEAQRRLIADAISTVDGRTLVVSASASGAGPWPQGVTEYYSWAMDRLTPLGLSLRTYLEQQHGE